MEDRSRDLVRFSVYFFLSLVLTGAFVVVSPVYISREQLLLSTCVAGGKWAIQILPGLIFLKEKRTAFIANISFVCFVGSCVLIPYIVLSLAGIANGAPFFTGSLAAAVLTMIPLYFRAVRKTVIPLYWWFFWLFCLAMAITLQLTIVFHVF